MVLPLFSWAPTAIQVYCAVYSACGVPDAPGGFALRFSGMLGKAAPAIQLGVHRYRDTIAAWKSPLNSQRRDRRSPS
jgi:hypothetical protein